MSQTYDAGCHCGYIKFSVTLSPPLPEEKPLKCDCSACRRFGYLLVCKSSPVGLSLLIRLGRRRGGRPLCASDTQYYHWQVFRNRKPKNKNVDLTYFLSLHCYPVRKEPKSYLYMKQGRIYHLFVSHVY